MFYRTIQKSLENWAQDPYRKPLVLRGARQVGKTTAVAAFAKNFEQYIYLNLENPIDKDAFVISKGIHVLMESIFVSKAKEPKEDTLIFIDEIQQVPGALNMLRYFYEEYPQIKVIAAGSLLETILNKNTQIPVGRVDYMVMRPVSFPEFLGAIGQDQALRELENIPLKSFAHGTLLRLFHTYALIGGMPEIVDRYVHTKKVSLLSPIYEQLIKAYMDDVEKYGRNDSLVKVIRHCIRACFTEAGKRIKFQRFGQSDYNSREVGESLRMLEKVFLLSLLYPTLDTTLPILPDFRKSPRLQVLDTGIMNYFLGIQTEILGTDDLNRIHQGTIIEHLVGQELLAHQFNPLSSLNFWTREKKTALAEIDFISPFESQLIPIEVKAGKDGSLKSLHIFMDKAPHDMAIRFYAGELQLTTTTTPEGKSYRLLNLPYYLASQTAKYISWLESQSSPI